MTIDDLIARCLGLIQRFVHDKKTRAAEGVLKAEVQLIAGEVFYLRMTGEEKARLLLRPMEEKLVGLYGPRAGRRLYWKFLEAFWIPSLSESCRRQDGKDGPGSTVRVLW